MSLTPCFSLLNFILLSISVNQLSLINVEMGFICKNLLSLYAILHTSTVKLSILWFAVVTGKNIEAHKIVFKSTKIKGQWYLSLISASDKRLNPSLSSLMYIKIFHK